MTADSVNLCFIIEVNSRRIVGWGPPAICEPSHLLDQKMLFATEKDPVHAETLRRRFEHLENVEIAVADLDESPPNFTGFDTALVLDGLQRTIDSKHFLRNVGSCVSHRGVGGLGARIFDMSVPLARLVDPLLPLDGLSLLTVARVP